MIFVRVRKKIHCMDRRVLFVRKLDMCSELVALLQINCNPIEEESHPFWTIRNKLIKVFLICLDVFLILMSNLLITTDKSIACTPNL